MRVLDARVSTYQNLALHCNGFPFFSVYSAHTTGPLQSTAVKQKDCGVKSARAEGENNKNRVIYADLHEFEDTAFQEGELGRERGVVSVWGYR